MHCRDVRNLRLTLTGAVRAMASTSLVDPDFDKDVVSPFLVDKGRMGFQRGGHIGYSRQFLVFDFNHRDEILSLGTRPSPAHRDQLAYISHLAGCQDWFGRMLEPCQGSCCADRLHVGKMLRRIDPVPDRSRHMDRQDSSVRMRTADKCD